LLALSIVYIVRRVASKRKVARHRPSAPRSAAAPVPGKSFLSRAWIATAALAVGIAGSSLIVDPRAEAAFDAPKRLVAILAIVVASLALLTTPDFGALRERRKRPPAQLAALVLAGCAILGATVAAIAAPRRAVSFDALRVVILFALLLPLGASRLLQRVRFAALLAVFIGASVINAAVSILQALEVFQPLSIESIAGRVSSVGLIGNEGYLGLEMAIAVAACLPVALRASSLCIRIASWAASALMLIALAISRNVTGWIALLAGLISLAWEPSLRRRIRSWRFAAAMMILLLGGAVMLASQGRVAGLIRQAHEGDWDRLLSYRLGPWAAALEMIRERPMVGFGPGSFGAQFVPHRLAAEIRWSTRFVNPQLISFFAQAHSDYLQGFAELGIPAALAAGGAIVALMFGLARKIRCAASGVDQEILIVMAMLLVGLTGAIAWPLLEQPALATPLLLAAGRGWRLLDDGVPPEQAEHPS
jgi:O-antigen ligase